MEHPISTYGEEKRTILVTTDLVQYVLFKMDKCVCSISKKRIFERFSCSKLLPCLILFGNLLRQYKVSVQSYIKSQGYTESLFYKCNYVTSLQEIVPVRPSVSPSVPSYFGTRDIKSSNDNRWSSRIRVYTRGTCLKRHHIEPLPFP